VRTARISQQVPGHKGLATRLTLAGCLAQALLAGAARAAPPPATKQGALAVHVRAPRAQAPRAAPRVPEPRAQTEIERCVAGALPSDGGAATTRTTFLLTGDAQVYTRRFAERQCLGFMAAGARHVQSLELSLRGHDGRVISQSAKPSSLAYARHCGAAGDVVFATVRVLDGQGEVVFASLPAQSQLPLAVRRLDACPALGTPRPSPLDVGPEPEGESIEQQLEAARAELSELGYDAGHLLAYGTLRPGQHAANGLVLSREHCYALLALGSHEIADLDLRVFGPTLPLTAAASDVSRSRSARVKLCAQAPARYVVDVSAFQGEGAYAVAALELSEPQPAPGVRGAARIPYAELGARMKARGFRAEVLTSGVLGRAEQLEVPLALAAGHCLAVGVIDASERASGGLSLGLKAADGELLALDTRGDAALVYHCVEAGQELRAVVSASPGRPRARFVLVVGREPEEAAP
jgi:hypothetical protein